MTTTVKRITLALTKEQQRQLEALCELYGETQSQVIHRAVSVLYGYGAPVLAQLKSQDERAK